MGFWGGVCEVDLDRYRDVVVPAFRAGETHPVVRSALEALQENRRWSYDFAHLLSHTGLADVMAHFNEDLTACDLGRDLHARGGPGRGSSGHSIRTTLTGAARVLRQRR